jgi:hypothetical protein
MKNTKRLIVWAAVVMFMSLIALAIQFTDEISKSEAMAYGIILLVGGGFFELWQWLKTRNKTYHVAFSLGLVGILLLGWVSGAVGIIGSENNPANLMYWAVPVVLLIGSLMARFQPGGMACTLLAAALVQISVPVVALFVWPAQASWGEAGVIGVFIANSIFAVLFAGSAWLFRRASLAGSKAGSGGLVAKP